MEKLIVFFKPLYDRWVAESPWRAKIITTIATICAVIVGMPEFLAAIDVQVPLVFEPYVTKIITVALVVLAIIGKLTRKPDTNQPDEKTDR